MQQKNSAEGFFTDMQSTLKQMIGNAPSGYPFDLKALMESQRKNIQAMTEVNRCAMQGWQTLARRQTEMVSQFVQDNSGLVRETMVQDTPETKFARQADFLKSSYEKSIQNSQELAELAVRYAREAAELVNQRVLASLGEIKASAKKDKA